MEEKRMAIKWNKSGTYKWVVQNRIKTTIRPFWNEIKDGDTIELKISNKWGQENCLVKIGEKEIITSKEEAKEELLSLYFKVFKEKPISLTLRTKIKILAIKKKTSASFWKGVEVGDIYELQYKVEEKMSFEKKYQPVISIYKDGVKVHEDTEGSFLNNSAKFEILEIQG